MYGQSTYLRWKGSLKGIKVVPLKLNIQTMGFFDKAKNAYSLQKQAKAIKDELKKTHIEAEEDGVSVTVSGEQEIIATTVTDDRWQAAIKVEFGKKQLEQAFTKAANKALKKAQEIGSEKMKGVFSQMGLS